MDGKGSILITGGSVISMRDDLPRVFAGAVGIVGNRIALVEAEGSPAIEDFRRRPGLAPPVEVDAAGMVVMPGLVNAHNHAAMTLMRGYGDDMGLMEWLQERIWPFEARMGRDDIAAGARLGVAEMLLGGTTTFVDMYRHESAVAAAIFDTGIRAVLASSVTDDLWDEFAGDMARLEAMHDGRGMIRAGLGPHAPYTCSPDTLLKIKDMAARLDCPVTIHVAETAEEVEIVRRRYGKTPVELLDGLGLLTPRTIAAHCVWLTDTDMETLARRGVGVAHCPQSNMKLASGVAPVAKLMEAGVNVAIGTDGPASNNDLDMWGEMRAAALLQKVSTADARTLPAYRVLRMATVGGARAIGMQGRLGVLAPGALADVVTVDMGRPHMNPVHDPVSSLVYCAGAGDVDTVIVDGRMVVRHGRLLSMDAAAAIAAAGRSAFPKG